ncbi:MAG TPA: RidA family protein [Xanthomonadales bacterium]|nr:RidA family protein [Xanthomonadales bacterium]
MKHINPPDWPRPSGYSNGIVAEGKMLFVAGMVGWNTAGKFPVGFTAQLEQVLENTVAVLRAGGAGPEHIVRMTWFVKDLEAYRQNLPAVGQIYRKVIGKNFPVMAVVGVNDLVERDALLEIETTAVLHG